MKYFWIILSAFILFLSITPCCDDEKHDAVTHTTISQSDHHDSHEHQACSPFCVCSCCGSHGVNIQQASIGIEAFLMPESEYKVSKPTSDLVSTFEANIWQPPQLG
ncbi:MAG: DUF6660 family protein [Bacteroidota bacterium]